MMLAHARGDYTAVLRVTLTTSLVMLLCGLTYRVLAARLAISGNERPPLAAATLAQFPRTFGVWTGTDVPLDNNIVRATGTDAHLYRRYERREDLDSILLYVACGVKARDLMPHRPEVCYIGAGWTLAERQTLDLARPDGGRLPCNVLQFSLGVLRPQRVVVLDYYLVDGQYCPDLSLLRSKIWRGSGAIGYVAQVQVTTSITTSVAADAAVQIVCDFARTSAPLVFGMFESSRVPPGPDGETAPTQGGRIRD
jgi:EpsI family protein